MSALTYNAFSILSNGSKSQIEMLKGFLLNLIKMLAASLLTKIISNSNDFFDQVYPSCLDLLNYYKAIYFKGNTSNSS